VRLSFHGYLHQCFLAARCLVRTVLHLRPASGSVSTSSADAALTIALCMCVRVGRNGQNEECRYDGKVHGAVGCGCEVSHMAHPSLSLEEEEPFYSGYDKEIITFAPPSYQGNRGVA